MTSQSRRIYACIFKSEIAITFCPTKIIRISAHLSTTNIISLISEMTYAFFVSYFFPT